HGHGAVVRLGQKSATGRSESLLLLSRHGAGPEDGPILGQRLLPARTGQRHGRREGPRHPAAESMAVLGVHDPGEHHTGQTRWQTSDVGGWKVGRRIHWHPLAQRYGLESELLLARTLRLRRGRPDETILERQPIRLVRRRGRRPPLHRADEEITSAESVTDEGGFGKEQSVSACPLGLANKSADELEIFRQGPG